MPCEVSFSVPRDVPGTWKKFIASPLEDLLPGTADLPAVDHTESLNDRPFGQVGSARQVWLADGNHAFEEIVESRPAEYLKYQVWGWSHPLAKPLEYATGEFWFTAHEQTTAVRWQYSFMLSPRSQLGRLGGLGRWLFRKAFIQRQWAAYMQAGAGAMAAWLATP
jgi:hypothetical protein